MLTVREVTSLLVDANMLKLYDHRTHNIDRLRYAVALYDWSYIKGATYITIMYNCFLAALSQLLHDNIPVNVIRLGVRDPPFITPFIKQLLCKRNKLRRRGKTSKANTLAVKINSLIIQSRSQSLSKLSEATSNQLWVAAKTSFSSKNGNSTLVDRILSDVDKVNEYFAGISYLPQCAGGFSSSVRFASLNDDLYINDFELEPYLQRLRPTAPRLDAIPSWFLCKCSYELAV